MKPLHLLLGFSIGLVVALGGLRWAWKVRPLWFGAQPIYVERKVPFLAETPLPEDSRPLSLHPHQFLLLSNMTDGMTFTGYVVIKALKQ